MCRLDSCGRPSIDHGWTEFVRPQDSLADRETKSMRGLDPHALDSITRLAEELLATPMALLHALSDEQLCQLTLLAEQAASLLDLHARAPDVVHLGQLEIDLTARAVTMNGEPVELSLKQFDLLAFMVARPGHVLSRSELLHHVWHSEPGWQDPSTVTEHIYRLRLKIEADPAKPKLLRTVRGWGYRLDDMNLNDREPVAQ
jgi:DNA-binding response OmpR family regulator